MLPPTLTGNQTASFRWAWLDGQSILTDGLSRLQCRRVHTVAHLNDPKFHGWSIPPRPSKKFIMFSVSISAIKPPVISWDNGVPFRTGYQSLVLTKLPAKFKLCIHPSYKQQRGPEPSPLTMSLISYVHVFTFSNPPRTVTSARRARLWRTNKPSCPRRVHLPYFHHPSCIRSTYAVFIFLTIRAALIPLTG